MYHYNAFISYNHNPRDRKIALLLQRKLESYKLPPEISGTYGSNGIKRVFLDTGELEVSGDLNTVITDALSNSDYLIVICSPESKSSIWVQREIEFFLQTHSKDRILTVITAGEPFDVLPDILLYEDKVDEKTGESTRVFLEPLSSDYRLPVHKANKQELPRLAAAIIGCRYDDLVQRQRVHALKRRAALLSAAAVILTASVSYLIWSNHQIRVNYENSLREQSLSLAMESEDALARGDRLGAVRYALDALPSDKKKRPVVSRAVLALSDALNLYRTSSSDRWMPVNQYKIDKGSTSVVPFGSDGKRYLAVVSMGGRVYLWDTDAKTEVMHEYFKELHDSGTDVYYCTVTEDKDLVLICKDSLISLDVSGGKEKYKVPFVHSSGTAAEAVRAAVQEEPVCSENDHLWIRTGIIGDSAILGIDLSNGKTVREVKLDEQPDRLRISDDGKTLALLYKDIDESDNDTVNLIDTGSGSVMSSISGAFITDVDFTGNNTLVTCGYTEQQDLGDPSIEPDLNSTSMDESNYYSSAVSRTAEVCCYDIHSGSLLWKKEKKDFFSGMPWLEIRKVSDSSKEDILCTVGNKVIDYTVSGSVAADIDFRSPVISYFHEDGLIRAILRDGSLAYYNEKEERFTSEHNIFPSYVGGAEIDYGTDDDRIFIDAVSSLGKINDSYILQYEFAGRDTELKEFEKDGADRIATNPYRNSCIEVITTASVGETRQGSAQHLIRRNMADGTVMLDAVITADGVGDPKNYRYSGLDEDKGLAYFTDIDTSDNPGLITVNLNTGETAHTPLTILDEVSDGMKYQSKQIDTLRVTDDDTAGLSCIRNGMIYCPALIYDLSKTAMKEKRLVLLTIDPEKGEAAAKDICSIDGSYRFVDDFMAGMNAECERLLLVTSSGKAECYDFSGEKLFASDGIGFTPAAAGICNDGTLLTAEKDDSSYWTVHRYDPESGTEISHTDLGYISSSESVLKEMPLSDGNTLLTLGDSYAFVLSAEDNSLLSRIPGAYACYNPETDEFAVGNKYKEEYGHVPYRTLDEIIAEGNALLNN